MQHYSLATGTLALICVTACSQAPSIPATAPAVSGARVAGKAPVIVLDARSSGPTVARDLYGASLDTWFAFWQGFVNPSLRKADIGLVRFPGGSESDAYHWENGGSLCDSMGYITPGATFDHLMTHAARPLDLDIAITLNYGSDRACNAGGQPSEAAAWVAEAKKRGYRVAYWTVGNEVYGSWEYDLHPHPHDPTTYADAVRTGYYPAVKKADPSVKLGVVVDLPSDTAWNDVVLKKAQPFDFVEVHYYPEYNVDSDAQLLGPDVDNFVGDLSGLRKQMSAAGVSKSVPIYLGEFNNDAGNEGKQSVSIVNGLFLGQMLGTLANAGVPMATWWVAYGSCDETGDYSKKLYGWQKFGSEALFSDGLPDPYEGCADTPKIPGGTPFPTARAMALFASAAPAGAQIRSASVPGSLGSRVRAYGFARSGGYALLLFNNTLHAIAIDARVDGSGKSGFSAILSAYGKTQYDQSKENKWTGPVSKSLGSVGTTVPLNLGPYSMTVLSLSS
ncbi:MAG TPA: hypothetical protein VGX91_06430 [Candidatus Cybelea sp.]|jgi:hypothetical protein|nr:hypothetical protein [Candidatus Cybelea sp.]